MWLVTFVRFVQKGKETEFGDFWLEGGIVRAVVYGGRGGKLWAAKGMEEVIFGHKEVHLLHPIALTFGSLA